MLSCILWWRWSGGCKVQEKENKFGTLICLGTENCSLWIDFGCNKAYGMARQEIAGAAIWKSLKSKGDAPSSGNKPGFGIRRVVRSDMLGEVGQEGKRKQTEWRAMNMLGKHFVCIFQFGNARKGEGGKYCLKRMRSCKTLYLIKKGTRMNIFYVTIKSESIYKSMEYAQHSEEKYCNFA